MIRNYTFENLGNNSFMVYTLAATDTIDTFSSGMLTNNKISGIVPYSYSVLDETRYFKYNVTSKTSLRQFFSGVVNRRRLTEVFLSMTSTLLAMDEYMLLPQCTVIDSSHIFVDISTNKAWLIYLPLLEEQYKELTFAEFIKQTIFSIQYDQSENCDYVAKLMNFVNAHSEFSLIEFEKLLKSLSVSEQKQGAVFVPPAAVMQPPQIPQQEQPPVVASSKKQKSAFKEQPPKNIPVKQHSTPAAPAIPPSKSPGAPAGAGFNIPGAINAIPPVVAPIKPPKEAKKSSLFSSLFSKKDKKKPESDHTPQIQQPQDQINIPPMYKPSGIQPQINAREHVVPVIVSNSGETSLLGLGNNGETTVLGAGNYSANQRPYLTRMKNGQKLFVDKPVFRLGKEKSYVDFFIGDNTAISRSHADIVSRNGEYFILDNNSTNHTYLDGIMIPSQLEMKIEHGSKIKLADEELEFKLF